MSLCKSRISSPLEAGTSVLDVDHLPGHLTEALEYASKRLARRSLHISLVVIRRDYQLPRAFPSPLSPALSVPSTPSSPAQIKTPLSPRFGFASSPITSFKKLVRSTSSAAASPLPSPACSIDSERSWRPRPLGLASHPPWPTTPRTPRTPLTPPPMTPLLSASTCSTDVQEACTPHPFGVRLVYAEILTDKQKALLHQTIEWTEKKFRIGPGWLPQPVDAASCGLSRTIANRSLLQQEVLFASEGLTLVPLDRLYTFKAALASYSRTAAPLRLEDAVDELRRLVLSRKRAQITRAELGRWYDWLSFSDAALRAVDRMYRRAYGGAVGEGAIEGFSGVRDAAASTVKEEVSGDEGESGSEARSQSRSRGGSQSESEVETDFETDSTRDREETADDGAARVVPREEDREKTPVARTVNVRASVRTVQIGKAPGPKGPALKLQTHFEKKPTAGAGATAATGPSSAAPAPVPQGQGSSSMVLPFGFAPLEGHKRSPVEEEDPLTARPVRQVSCWSPVTIASDGSRGGDGPMTPNGYDDISPITRGEWGFLMGDGGVRQGMKTAAVMTF